jgi:hypothetical protein
VKTSLRAANVLPARSQGLLQAQRLVQLGTGDEPFGHDEIAEAHRGGVAELGTDGRGCAHPEQAVRRPMPDRRSR